MEAGSTQTEIMKQPTEPFWSECGDLTSDKSQMTAWLPHQDKSKVEVIQIMIM